MVSLGVALPRLPFAQCAPPALQGSPQQASVKRRENRCPQIVQPRATVTKEYGRYNRSHGYSWHKRSSSSGDFNAAHATKLFSPQSSCPDCCTTCTANFSVNSRLLCRKPAMLHQWRSTSAPPDPDAPLATRHPPLLFHKPLPLYRLQSSIKSPNTD